MLPIPAVPHRDHRIAAQAAQLGATDGRTAKFFAKLLGFHFCDPLQGGIHESFTRLKLGSLRGRSSAVPRADILADVATKQVPAHTVTQFLGNGASLFDSEIRDALVRIEAVGAKESVGRARVETAGAGSAAIGSGQIGNKFQ